MEFCPAWRCSMQKFFSLPLVAGLLWVYVVQPTRLQAQEHKPASVGHNVSDIQFAKVPGAPECFTSAVEQGDPNSTASVLLMRGEAGCTAPWHWHPSTETIMMVSGTARAEMRDDTSVLLKPQGYLSVPPHHVMRFTCTQRCTLFLHTDGPFVIHYVDATGKEIPADEALKAKPQGVQRPR